MPLPNTNIDGLNALPGDYEPGFQPAPQDMESDLTLFTNANFFDWDAAEAIDPSFEALSAQPSNASFGNNNLAFQDLPQIPNAEPFAGPQHQQLPDQQWAQPSPPTTMPSSTTSRPARRRADSTRQSVDMSPAADALQVSAEEDKRRRNTAASARFRVKKKQREQAMEKTAKEMTDRVQSLEARVVELEKENKLLKGLLTEKSSAQPASSQQTPRARGKPDVEA